MVDVSSQNNSVSINVSSSGNSASIKATPDTALYYSEKSREWAISDRIVDGKDYSSKYYANKSAISESNAKGYAQSSQDTYNQFQKSVEGALSNVDIAVQGAVESINTKSVEAIDNINSTKTTILNDIEFVADGEKEEIRDIIDTGKDEIQELTNEIKDNAEEIANRTSFALFDTKLSDHILTYEETKGWALQGTYVYKEALAGSRYGYPDFYAKCLEEYNEATTTETVNGVEIKVHSNGHKFYDIANKDAIDSFFNTMGSAWFYGVDTENERIFLPRNNWFEQASVSEVGQSVEAGLPNITGGIDWVLSYSGGASGAFYNSGNENGNTGANYQVGRNYKFDASRSNSIYGNSNTVQPNAVKKLLYICVGNTTNYEGMTEVVNQGMEILEQVNQGIESRANIDITNLSSVGKNMIANLSMPDYEKQIVVSAGYNTWVQVVKNSWVVAFATDAYLEDARAYVSRDKSEVYTVGYRYDDTNGNTEGTSFSFFVPAGWYCKTTLEHTTNFYIYPLKGAN